MCGRRMNCAILSRHMDQSQAQAQCKPSNKINSKNGTESKWSGKFISEQMQTQLLQPTAYDSYNAMILGHSPLPSFQLTWTYWNWGQGRNVLLWVDLTHNFVKESVMIGASESPKASYLDRWTDRAIIVNKCDLVMSLWWKENSKPSVTEPLLRTPSMLMDFCRGNIWNDHYLFVSCKNSNWSERLFF